MKRGLFVCAFLILSAVAVSRLLAEDNPFVGTWKLNAAKSKSEPTPGPTSMTRTIVAQGQGAKYSFEGVAGDGSAVKYSFETNYDGKDSAVTGTGMPGGADTIALKRINSHKVEGKLKNGGTEVGTAEAEVSKDGKVSTVKTNGKTADGKEYHSEAVYDKQ